MSIDEYRAKRNFEKTPEPQPKVKHGANNIYVIQRHQARNLHWDLRLEKDGVLVSWAVPKEPPTEKGVRRLAIQTEDHPIDYATFEGCLEYNTSIMTENGPRRIGDIVNRRKRLRVLSYNRSKNVLEWKPILNWFKHERITEFLKIRVPQQLEGACIITITGNHKVYTPLGMVFARELDTGDTIFVLTSKSGQKPHQLGAVTPVQILSIEHVRRKLEERQQWFDLHIQENNNYFADSLLVSNSIPEGEYGAGIVEVWDTGTYETEKWSKAEIIVQIHGNRLKGRFCLIRFMKVKNGWLFFKCGE